VYFDCQIPNSALEGLHCLGDDRSNRVQIAYMSGSVDDGSWDGCAYNTGNGSRVRQPARSLDADVAGPRSMLLMWDQYQDITHGRGRPEAVQPQSGASRKDTAGSRVLKGAEQSLIRRGRSTLRDHHAWEQPSPNALAADAMGDS
jgi:hypothetical protein